MPQYKVRHQCDRTCADCGHYDRDTFEDSFGPFTDETCAKSHYDRVGYFADACDDFVSDGTEEQTD